MAKEKILVVDDEQDLVKLIRYHLEKDGYQVLSAYNGEDALFLSRKERPELLILDLMLPGMDGLEVCKKIKSRPGSYKYCHCNVNCKRRGSRYNNGFKIGCR